MSIEVKKNFLQLEGVVCVTLNQKQNLNALSKNLVGDLKKTLLDLKEDSSLRILCFSSAVEKIFCVGADLKERLKMNDSEVLVTLSDLNELMNLIEDVSVPTIACIDGAAFGGGFELALSCDLRLLGTQALLGLTETSLAIIPGAGGTQRLTRIVGMGKSLQMILCAEKLGQVQAGQYGLGICIDFSFEDQLKDFLLSLLSKGPIALKAAKWAIKKGSVENMKDALAIEKQAYQMVLKSKDRIEGLNSFAEKRKPVYTGQ